MSLALLLPMGLLALAALAVPLLIHLIRRNRQQPVEFAALRWLRERPRPRQRLRFDEWWLLALRLLLLVLLALLLARPVLQGHPDRRPWWVLVPGASPAALPSDLPADARVHWLAPGFPPFVADGAAPAPTASPTSLLRELDARLPAGVTLTVLASAVLDGVDAQRPRLSRPVDWRVVAGPAAEARPAASLPPTRIALRHPADCREACADALRPLKAAAAALAQPPAVQVDVGPATQALPAGTTELWWFGDAPLPAPFEAWVRAGGTVLVAGPTAVAAPASAEAASTVAWADDAGRPLIEARRLGQGRWLRVTRPLQPAVFPQLLEADFPRQLQRALQPPPTAPARVLAADHAPLVGARSYPQPPRDLSHWLIALIAGLFVLERWLASGRRRGAIG